MVLRESTLGGQVQRGNALSNGLSSWVRRMGGLKAVFCQGAVGLHFPFVSVRDGKGREDVEDTTKLLQNLRSG